LIDSHVDIINKYIRNKRRNQKSKSFDEMF